MGWQSAHTFSQTRSQFRNSSQPSGIILVGKKKLSNLGKNPHELRDNRQKADFRDL